MKYLKQIGLVSLGLVAIIAISFCISGYIHRADGVLTKEILPKGVNKIALGMDRDEVTALASNISINKPFNDETFYNDRDNIVFVEKNAKHFSHIFYSFKKYPSLLYIIEAKGAQKITKTDFDKIVDGRSEKYGNPKKHKHDGYHIALWKDPFVEYELLYDPYNGSYTEKFRLTLKKEPDGKGEVNK